MAGELGYDTGPFVTLAVFCDQAIEDKDGVLTLIRIVDQMTLEASGPEAPDELPPGAAINTTLAIGLKAGKAQGKQTVQVVVVHPNGSRHPGPDLPIYFSGGEHQGNNVVFKAGINLTDQGLYWAEILVNDRIVTRTPLEIRYHRQLT